MSPPSKKTRRFIYRGEVMNRVGKSFPTLWLWMQQGRFPRAHDSGDGELAWWEDEVDRWMNARPVKQFKSDKIKAAKASA